MHTHTIINIYMYFATMLWKWKVAKLSRGWARHRLNSISEINKQGLTPKLWSQFEQNIARWQTGAKPNQRSHRPPITGHKQTNMPTPWLNQSKIKAFALLWLLLLLSDLSQVQAQSEQDLRLFHTCINSSCLIIYLSIYHRKHWRAQCPTSQLYGQEASCHSTQITGRGQLLRSWECESKFTRLSYMAWEIYFKRVNLLNNSLSLSLSLSI